jgi:hypothetical protein
MERTPNSFVLSSETDMTARENGKEMNFDDHAFGSDLRLLLRDIIDRKKYRANNTILH